MGCVASRHVRAGSSQAKIFVAVYSSAVISPPTPKHWALYISSKRRGPLVLQVKNDIRNLSTFIVAPPIPTVPSHARTFERKIYCGAVEDSVYDQVLSTIVATPIKTEPGWNCQAWCRDALQALVTSGLIPPIEPHALEKLNDHRNA